MIQLLKKRGEMLEQSWTRTFIDGMIDGVVVAAFLVWLLEARMVVPA